MGGNLNASSKRLSHKIKCLKKVRYRFKGTPQPDGIQGWRFHPA